MQQLAEELTRIKDLLRAHPQGMSVTEIASALGKNKHSTGRYLDILHAAGFVDLRTFGMAKVFTLSSRIPLSALLSYTTDLVIVLDRDLRIVQGNDPFFNLLHLPGEKILQSELTGVQGVKSTVSAFLSDLAEAVRNREESSELEMAGEKILHFRAKIIPTVFEDGSSGTTIILEDTTVEKEALATVKKSEEFFRSVADHLSDGLVVKEEKKITFFNQRLCDIIGYSPEEIMRIKPGDIALAEEKKRYLKVIAEAQQDRGSMKEIRFWGKKKNGTPIYLSLRITQVSFEDRVRCYTLVTDMTRWKEQEEAQSLQVTLIKRLMKNFPHPLFIIGTDGVFFMVNNTFCDLIKVDPDSVSGKHATEVLPPGMAEEFLQGNEELAKKEGTVHEHTLMDFFRPDGTTGEVLIEKSPVSAGENSPAYIFGAIVFETDYPSKDSDRIV